MKFWAKFGLNVATLKKCLQNKDFMLIFPGFYPELIEPGELFMGP